jgi:hypothetical protein
VMYSLFGFGTNMKIGYQTKHDCLRLGTNIFSRTAEKTLLAPPHQAAPRTSYTLYF